MGLEEHLLTMFRDDFEFHDDAGASHLAKSRTAGAAADAPSAATGTAAAEDAVVAVAAAPEGDPLWSPDAEKELKKIPFFVRPKARRNAERFAAERGVATITVETLYDAKAHYGR